MEQLKDFIKEGLYDTSWDNGKGDKISLIELLYASKDIPVEEIDVNILKSKVLSWDGNNEEISKIESSDLQYPILIFVDDNRDIMFIVDGNHRVQKALRHGLETIKSKLIPFNTLPKHIKKVFE